ncbi:hypothetical protein E2C01_078102 [Portunus trituberculatus]|uniref:Uncharacterized protein n=1 Tax=Portunus trituberculatus TaxID=210409 RepID=A0A5B7ILR9_PORTR|nr:hypothetical protein [Portunus trituberculatus]
MYKSSLAPFALPLPPPPPPPPPHPPLLPPSSSALSPVVSLASTAITPSTHRVANHSVKVRVGLMVLWHASASASVSRACSYRLLRLTFTTLHFLKALVGITLVFKDVFTVLLMD